MPEHRELDELRMIHSTIGKFLVDTAENRILEGAQPAASTNPGKGACWVAFRVRTSLQTPLEVPRGPGKRIPLLDRDALV